MWISIYDMPVPTHGQHGKEFFLNLQYGKYFGHYHNLTSEVAIAIWDSTYECFFEKEAGLAIDDRDIIEWWSE